MNTYTVWSGDVWMGYYSAESWDDAIDQAVTDGGGHEMDYDACLMEEDNEQ